jgi:molybdopterin-binding protein
VAASVYPWDVAIEPPGATSSDSALNQLAAEVTSLTPLGNRVRIGLVIPQPLAADVTARSAEALGLRPGAAVVATWKATATRLVDL